MVSASTRTLRVRLYLYNGLDAPGNLRRNLCCMSSALHRTAEARRYGRPRRQVQPTLGRGEEEAGRGSCSESAARGKESRVALATYIPRERVVTYGSLLIC